MGIRGACTRAVSFGVGAGLCLAACGGDDGTASVQSGGSVVPSGIESRVAEVIPGEDRLLVIDPETRETEFVAASPDETVVVETAPALPGEGPLINVSGVQTAAGAWVVAGTDCASIETSDPAGCSPGTMTIAVLEDGSWRTVGEQPAEFTRSFVAADSSSGDRVLFRRWDRGASNFWLLDLAADGFQGVGWSPAPLELGPSLTAGEDLETASEPTRTSCLTGDQLVVAEADISDGALLARIVVVDVTDPTTGDVVAETEVELAEAASLMPMTCADGHQPYLIALGRGNTGALAYGLVLDGSDIGQPVASPGDGVVAGIDYGQASVAIRQQSQPGQGSGGTTPVDPGGGAPAPNEADRPTVEVAVFQDGTWDGPAAGEEVTSGEEVVPLADPELPLIAVDESEGAVEYRAIEREAS